MEGNYREMTLEEYINRLPIGHRAYKEYKELIEKVEDLEKRYNLLYK